MIAGCLSTSSPNSVNWEVTPLSVRPKKVLPGPGWSCAAPAGAAMQRTSAAATASAASTFALSRPRFIGIPFDWMGSFTFPNTARTRWFFWAVVGLTALAAAIRFSTLGLQSYRHDEAVTAGRVLFAGSAADHARGLVRRVDPAALLPARLVVVSPVRRPRGGPALALGGLRHRHGPARLSGRAGADRPSCRPRRRRDRRGRADAGLVFAGRPRLRAARPALHRGAALLLSRPADGSRPRPRLVGRLLGAGAQRPLLRRPPAGDRGRLAAARGAAAAPGAVGGRRGGARRPRAGADRPAPGRLARTTTGSRASAWSAACARPGSVSSSAKRACSSTR